MDSICVRECAYASADIENLFFVSSTGTQEKACWSTVLRCTVGKEGFDRGDGKMCDCYMVELCNGLD